MQNLVRSVVFALFAAGIVLAPTTQPRCAAAAEIAASRESKTIYMAGPLFTLAERRFNRELRDELKKVGYDVFLPQDSASNNESFDAGKIARDDRSHVYAADVIVVNLDGTMVDDGTALEAGMAIARSKITIGYRTDFRLGGEDAKLRVNLMFTLLDEIVPFSAEENDSKDAPHILALRIHEAIKRRVAARGTIRH